MSPIGDLTPRRGWCPPPSKTGAPRFARSVPVREKPGVRGVTLGEGTAPSTPASPLIGEAGLRAPLRAATNRFGASAFRDGLVSRPATVSRLAQARHTSL